jgi:NADH:ubiquinone oxidoreductase subunit 3 (subunit A)
LSCSWEQVNAGKLSTGIDLHRSRPAGRCWRDVYGGLLTGALPCGFEAFEDARMNFDVRYYLVAILFIIFDLEIAFLFPWAIVLDEIGLFGIVAMGIFLGILVIGFIYEWKKGALEWE